MQEKEAEKEGRWAEEMGGLEMERESFGVGNGVEGRSGKERGKFV